MRLPLLTLLLAVAAVPCRAQNLADIPPPKPPLVAAFPDNADWTITFQPGKPTPAPSPKDGRHLGSFVTEVHSTKTGKLRRDEITYSDGTKTVHYLSGTLIIFQDNRGNVMTVDLKDTMEPIPVEDPDPTRPDVFSGTKWLQISYYDKAVAVQQRPCHHYAHGDNEAWIDAETKMPVAYKSSAGGYSYKFNDPPTETLILPPEIEKAVRQYQSSIHKRQLLEQPQVKRT